MKPKAKPTKKGKTLGAKKLERKVTLHLNAPGHYPGQPGGV